MWKFELDRWTVGWRRTIALMLCLTFSGAIFYTFCFVLQDLSWTPLHVVAAGLYFLLLVFGSINLVLYGFGY